MTEGDVLDTEPSIRERPEVPAGRRSILRRAALLAAATAVLALGLSVVRQRQRNEARDSDSAGVAAFLSAHHRQCEARDSGTPHEFERLSADLVCIRVAAATLGAVPDIDRILSSSSFVFEGMGRCSVPAGGASVHLLLSLPEDELTGAAVSVFVQRGPSAMPLDEDIAHRLTPRNRADDQPEILAWKRGDLVFFVVSSRLQLARFVHSGLAGPPERTSSCLGWM